jgi:hypothetical protein
LEISLNEPETWEYSLVKGNEKKTWSIIFN